MKVPMTPRGHATLQQELKRLKAMRSEIAAAIEHARGQGDISENADYDAAKERSGMTEAKIRDLESKLGNAQIIDPRKLGEISRAVFGASVKYMDVDSEEERVITIVGVDECDVSKGLISFESPLAKALIGKEQGDTVTVFLPGGQREIEIVEIFVEYTEITLE